MPGKHANPLTLQSVVSEHVTIRARELVSTVEYFDSQPLEVRASIQFDKDAWIGSATEILRELSRDA